MCRNSHVQQDREDFYGYGMSNDVVICVENLYKEYRLGTISHGTLYRDLQSWWARMRGKEDPNSIISFSQPFTSHVLPFTDVDNPHMLALSDVSFEVRKGDVLGIIGKNGAGKSTLLKILSEVTSPTKGMVKIKGRVASLLEVGPGFHPELTGSENIYLNGAILGMTKKEIAGKFDEIVAFAEIEKFIDTPVKRYSSGMYVRLAFAVAAHLEPEILIVDEVLAVGDAQFQKKCLGKMGDVAKEGRTVLFVSHNMESLLNLCSSAMLLQNGHLVASGEIRNIVHQYLSQSSASIICQEWKDTAKAPGNDKAKLIKALVKPLHGPLAIFQTDIPLEFEFEFINLLTDETNLDVTYHLVDERGILVYVASTGFSRNDRFRPGLVNAKCRVPGNLLNEGTYTVSRLLLVRDRGTVIFEQRDVLMFDIITAGTGQPGWAGQKEGVIRPNLEWELSFDDRLVTQQNNCSEKGRKIL
jgi:lipopolysaccharide transport system ATP-binding protein